MANQVIGKIVSIGQTQNLTSKTGSAFQKRDVVLNVQRYDPYTGLPATDWENTPKLSFMGEKCRELDRFQVGQMVVISFDLQGRKYETANHEIDIITEARPYRIELYGQRANQPAPQQATTPSQPQAPIYPQQPAMQSGQMQQSQQQSFPQQPQVFDDSFK